MGNFAILSGELPQEHEPAAELHSRLNDISIYLLQLCREISSKNKAYYPTQVFLDSCGIARLKQTPDYHSYSVLTHSKIAFSVASYILEQDYSTDKNLSYSPFFNSNSAFPLLQHTQVQRANSPEVELRAEVLEKSIALAQRLRFTDADKTILTLGAGCHDIGKFLEPELKDMEEVPYCKGTVRIRRVNGKRLILRNRYYEEKRLAGLLPEAVPTTTKINHSQDFLTRAVYKDMQANGLLTIKELETLDTVHQIFTEYSMGRYAENSPPIPEILSIEHAKIIGQAILLLCIDEIAKGTIFSASETAKIDRMRKFTYLLTLITSFTEEIAALN